MTRSILLHYATIGIQALLIGMTVGVLVRIVLEEWALWRAEREETMQIHTSSSAYRPWRGE